MKSISFTDKELMAVKKYLESEYNYGFKSKMLWSALKKINKEVEND